MFGKLDREAERGRSEEGAGKEVDMRDKEEDDDEGGNFMQPWQEFSGSHVAPAAWSSSQQAKGSVADKENRLKPAAPPPVGVSRRLSPQETLELMLGPEGAAKE